ncbi:hypothetical protein [Streptomyces dysideae]|uniref:Uncharacterized protein n=1 Tax=Streptomyces dysideae TaxID=909626 RepID=A0A124IEA9_9ACTN|nr:hypothetical protein [Streptomyces dysideae]KUO17721.1 hypothetical protein AQJ91_28850 [Streptomyces dysideae]
MTTAWVSAFLLAHGLVHLTVWLPHATRNSRSTRGTRGRSLRRVCPGPGMEVPPVERKPRPGEDRAAVGFASVTTLPYVIAGAAVIAAVAMRWPGSLY